MKKDTKKWCDFHKIPWHNTTYFHSKKSLVAKVKSLESYADSNSDSKPKNWRWIIDVEPSSTINTSHVNLMSQRKESTYFIHRCG
jgi:hypothetical protein